MMTTTLSPLKTSSRRSSSSSGDMNGMNGVVNSLMIYFQVDFEAYMSRLTKKCKKPLYLSFIPDHYHQMVTIPIKTHGHAPSSRGYKKRGKLVSLEASVTAALYNTKGLMQVVDIESKDELEASFDSDDDICVKLQPAYNIVMEGKSAASTSAMVRVITKGGKDRLPQQWLSLQHQQWYKLTCWYRRGMCHQPNGVPFRLFFGTTKVDYSAPSTALFHLDRYCIRDCSSRDASIAMVAALTEHDIEILTTRHQIYTVTQLAAAFANIDNNDGMMEVKVAAVQRVLEWIKRYHRQISKHQLVAIYTIHPSATPAHASSPLALSSLLPIEGTSMGSSDCDVTMMQMDNMIAGAASGGLRTSVAPTPTSPLSDSSSAYSDAKSPLPLSTTMSPAGATTSPTIHSARLLQSSLSSPTPPPAAAAAAALLVSQQREEWLTQATILFAQEYGYQLDTEQQIAVVKQLLESEFQKTLQPQLPQPNSGTAVAAAAAVAAAIVDIAHPHHLVTSTTHQVQQYDSDSGRTVFHVNGVDAAVVSTGEWMDGSVDGVTSSSDSVDAAPSPLTTAIATSELDGDIPPAWAEAALDRLKNEYGCYKNEADTPTSFAAAAHYGMRSAWRAFVQLQPLYVSSDCYIVNKTNFISRGGSVLNGGADYTLTQLELHTLWSICQLGDDRNSSDEKGDEVSGEVNEEVLTFDDFLRLFNFIGHNSNFDQLPFIDLKCLCSWLHHHFYSLRSYCHHVQQQQQHDIGSMQHQRMLLFMSRAQAQELLQTHEHITFCLRLCEGRYDRLVEDVFDGIRQPVHRQLVVTTRSYTADGNVMPARYYHHLLLNIADEKTPRQRITVLGLDGSVQYDNLDWLIKSRASTIVKQLQDRNVSEELVQRHLRNIEHAQHAHIKSHQPHDRSAGDGVGTKKQPDSSRTITSSLSSSSLLGGFPRLTSNPHSLYRRKGFHLASSPSLPRLDTPSSISAPLSVPALDFGGVIGYAGPATDVNSSSDSGSGRSDSHNNNKQRRKHHEKTKCGTHNASSATCVGDTVAATVAACTANLKGSGEGFAIDKSEKLSPGSSSTDSWNDCSSCTSTDSGRSHSITSPSPCAPLTPSSSSSLTSNNIHGSSSSSHSKKNSMSSLGGNVACSGVSSTPSPLSCSPSSPHTTSTPLSSYGLDASCSYQQPPLRSSFTDLHDSATSPFSPVVSSPSECSYSSTSSTSPPASPHTSNACDSSLVQSPSTHVHHPPPPVLSPTPSIINTINTNTNTKSRVSSKLVKLPSSSSSSSKRSPLPHLPTPLSPNTPPSASTTVRNKSSLSSSINKLNMNDTPAAYTCNASAAQQQQQQQQQQHLASPSLQHLSSPISSSFSPITSSTPSTSGRTRLRSLTSNNSNAALAAVQQQQQASSAVGATTTTTAAAAGVASLNPLLPLLSSSSSTSYCHSLLPMTDYDIFAKQQHALQQQRYHHHHHVHVTPSSLSSSTTAHPTDAFAACDQLPAPFL